MVELVDPKKIEQIVGEQRHTTFHIGRAKSEDKNVYIMHSKNCLDEHADDLTVCSFSVALDNTPDPWQDDLWDKMRDKPVVLSVVQDRIVPVGIVARHYNRKEQSK